MGKSQSNPNDKTTKQVRPENVIESLNEIGQSVKQSIKEDLLGGIKEDAFNQLLGSSARKFEKKVGGEIHAGESLTISEKVNANQDRESKIQKQLIYERRLKEEERIVVSKKTGELRMQLQAITQEITYIASTTQGLAQETRIAVMQAPIEPGPYHIQLVQKLLEFLQNYRKEIKKSMEWLHVANKRAQKKNYWGMYKKHGAKFLLSSESYSQRSAG